jgi:hypothetical protein
MENGNLFEDDWGDDGLQDIIAEQEQKEAEAQEQQEKASQEERELLLKGVGEAVTPLVEAVNKTNQLIQKSDTQSAEVTKAIREFQKALYTSDGRNIADYIAEQLNDHKTAMANSGIDKLTESWMEQAKVMEKLQEVFKEEFQRLGRSYENTAEAIGRNVSIQNSNIEEFAKVAKWLKPALEKPKEAVLDSGDRWDLQNVGERVSKAINKQKWWWVGWGIGVFLSLVMFGWGVYSKIEAGKALDEAHIIYKNHQYTWNFWYYMNEDWGKSNPTTYGKIREAFENKYPELVKLYREENPEIAEEANKLK